MDRVFFRVVYRGSLPSFKAFGVGFELLHLERAQAPVSLQQSRGNLAGFSSANMRERSVAVAAVAAAAASQNRSPTVPGHSFAPAVRKHKTMA